MNYSLKPLDNYETHTCIHIKSLKKKYTLNKNEDMVC